MNDFKIGTSNYFRSFSFLFKNGLAHYFIYPIVLVIILTVFFAHGIGSMVDVLGEYIYTLFNIEAEVIEDQGFWDTVKYWLANASKYSTMAILYVLFYYISFKVNKYVVLILMSPIMALLSERTEEILTGNIYPFEFSQLLKDVWRGVLIALRNMFIELGIVVAVWVFGILLGSIFPPIMLLYAPVASVFLFAVGAYFYGFSTMDYTNERRRMKLGESVRFIRTNRGIAVSNGMAFSLWLFIPILGPIIAPITCSCGATLAIHDKIDLGESEFELKKTPKINPE